MDGLGIATYTLDVKTGNLKLDGDMVSHGPNAGEQLFSLDFWKTQLHPKDRRRVESEHHNRLENRQRLHETEYRVRLGSRRYGYFLDRSRIVDSEPGGYPKTICGCLIDISDRKKREEKREKLQRKTTAAVERSEGEKASILQALSGLVSIRFLDPELRIAWSNMDDTSGTNGDVRKSSGDYCYKIIRGRTEPCDLICTPKLALASGMNRRRETILDDGRSFVVSANPVKDRSGKILGVIYIRLNVTQHRKMEEEYQVTHRFLHSFLRNSPTPITVFDRNGNIDMVNPAWEKLVGMHQEQAVGQRSEDIFPGNVSAQILQSGEEVLQSGNAVEFEESVEYPSGMRHFHTVNFPLYDAAGNIVNIGAISVDITARKQAEQKLAKHESELRIKSLQLEETNTALRVLLKQREADQRQLEEKIVTNVNQLVLPYVHKLKGMRLNENQKSCLEMAETHLNDIVAPFLRYVVSEFPNMTATEIQVATLVREGKTNKDIASLMSISVNTVQIHRHNVRKKLGLQNKKVNLRSYLLSLNPAKAALEHQP